MLCNISSNSSYLQYYLCRHFTSSTALHQLDQFVVGELESSAWKVRRVCDVRQERGTVTEVPVQSCHYHWSVHNSSHESPTFGPTTNSSLRFFLRLYRQELSQISIHLCLEENDELVLEEETKVLVKIAIKDKKENEIDTKGIATL